MYYVINHARRNHAMLFISYINVIIKCILDLGIHKKNWSMNVALDLDALWPYSCVLMILQVFLMNTLTLLIG